jgi:hypothetical protein
MRALYLVVDKGLLYLYTYIQLSFRKSFLLSEMWEANRVARFLLVQTYRNGKIYQITTNYVYPTAIDYTYKMTVKYIFRVFIKYANIFHSKALQNLPHM